MRSRGFCLIENMRYRIIFLTVFVGYLLTASQASVRGDNIADTDTVNLQLEVDALFALHDLNLSPDQLTALQGLISDTEGKLSDPPTAITAECKAALKTTQTCLLCKDQGKIDDAEDKLGILEDKQDPDSDPDISQSGAAKEKAGTFLKMLSAKQVASYIAENSDNLHDPVQLILDAVHHARDSSDEDFESLRDDTSDEIEVLFAGPHPGKRPPIVGKVNQLLTKVRHLSADDYKSQLPALEQEARQLVTETDPIPHLRHWMENELADLLSNPQLGQAIGEMKPK